MEVHPFEDEPDEEEQPVAIALMLLFRFRPLYPSSEGPELRLCAESGISDADAATVQSSLEASVPDLLGMAMIYEMTERIKEEVRTIVRAKAPAAASGAGASASEAATHSTSPATETSGSSFAESMRADDICAAAAIIEDKASATQRVSAIICARGVRAERSKPIL